MFSFILSCNFLFLKISIAQKIAFLKELEFARFFPAISYPVPWSGEVLILLSPAVKLTPSPNERVLKGINPWS